MVLPAPTKVIATHLNYRSRANERGQDPRLPSYFLKPPSSIASTGDPVVRPADCELLAFEGEIALVIGAPAHRVHPDDGWDHVGWVTAANDFGVYDLRHADRGSNLRSKGIDGFTPMGPELIDARLVDPNRLRLRTRVNGELAQEAITGQELLFSLGLIVADLSRLTTLEEGDVILTGTPAGSSVVVPGDEVVVEVDADGHSSGLLRNSIVESAEPLADWGAMPVSNRAAAALAYGARNAGDPVEARYGAMTASRLRTIATATLASQLNRRGLLGCILNGLTSTRPDLRLLGFARTVRFLPRREDLSPEKTAGLNAQKRAAEGIGPGEVLVISARGDEDAGTIGDILAMRALVNGATGVITDGAIRDAQGVSSLDLPVYHRCSHPAVLGRRHVPWDTDVAVSCAGVLVTPGDLLVGDADGVVLVPDSLVATLVSDAWEQERQERFVLDQVRRGSPITGLYPIGEQWLSQYELWSEQVDAQ